MISGHPSLLLGVLVGLYVLVGAGVATLLVRRGAGAMTALSAVGVWPLLLSALDPATPTVARPGPMSAPIADALLALEAALAHPAVNGGSLRAEVDGLREVLLRADERLGLADRLLADTAEPQDPDVARSHRTLAAARDHTTAEIEAVLSGVVQLRLQVGLLALAGDAGGVGERLCQLRARVTAIDEVERLG